MTEFKNNTLSSLLYKSYSKNDVTHMDMFNKRSYSVKDEEDFLVKYTRAYTYLTKTKNFNKYLLERTTNIGPVIVDIDLCKNLKEPKPLYSEKKVLTLAKLFQKILKENLVKHSEKDLDCFVLEKPGYFKEKMYKNGFHLHFPYVWLTQRERYYINKLVQEKSKFTLDNAVIGGNWFLYGSKKSPNSNPYLLSYIIEEKRNHVLNILSAPELIYLLSVRQKPHTVVSKLSFVPEVEEKPLKVFDFENHTKTPEEDLEEYIKEIPNNVAEDYTTWRSIGCALFNETHGEEYGKELFKTFSQKCPEKYNEEACETFWEKMTETKYSLGTIIHYTKEIKKKQKFKKKPVIKIYL